MTDYPSSTWWYSGEQRQQSADTTADRLVRDFVARNSSRSQNIQPMSSVDYWRQKAGIDKIDSPNDLTQLQLAIRNQEDAWNRPAPSAAAPKPAAAAPAQAAAPAAAGPAAKPAQNLTNPFDPYKYQSKNDPGTTDYFSSGPGYMDKFLAEEEKRQDRQRIRDAAEGDGSQSVADKRLDDLFKPKDDAQPATEVTAQLEDKQGGGLRDRIKQEMFSDPFEKDRKRKAGSGSFLNALMSTTTY
jgi:hypothetical protein